MNKKDVANLGKLLLENGVDGAIVTLRKLNGAFGKVCDTYNFVSEVVPVKLPRIPEYWYRTAEGGVDGPSHVAVDDYETRRTAEAEMKAEEKRLEREAARKKAEAEARAEAERKARIEAERKVREEARRKAEAKKKAEAEAKKKAAAEAKKKAEAEAKKKAEAEAKKKAEAEAKKKAEAEAKKKAEAEAKKKAEAEAKKKAEAEAKKKAEAEAKKKKAEAEAKKKKAAAKPKAEPKKKAEAKPKAEPKTPTAPRKKTPSSKAGSGKVSDEALNHPEMLGSPSPMLPKDAGSVIQQAPAKTPAKTVRKSSAVEMPDTRNKLMKSKKDDLLVWCRQNGVTAGESETKGAIVDKLVPFLPKK